MRRHEVPRDDDPSGMTDFEKNATQGELEQVEQEPPETEGVENRERPERGNRGPDDQPGFGQGA